MSKWETDASIPELDKLIQLSELFDITLDELVRGEAVSREEAAQDSEPQVSPPQIIIQKTISTQRVVGFILLVFGLLCCLLAFFFGGGLFVVGGYIILCSVLCLLLRKYAGLVIGWLTLLLTVILAPYFTGIQVFAIFDPGYYQDGISISQIITIGMWLLFCVLMFFTEKVFRKKDD